MLVSMDLVANYGPGKVIHYWPADVTVGLGGNPTDHRNEWQKRMTGNSKRGEGELYREKKKLIKNPFVFL